MATYKVIQDIEAEDKLLGPLTLRQFIYALVCAFFLYICFIVVTKGTPFLLAVFLPPAIFTGFFAFPFMKDQPTEVWALAKIRFMVMPRKRIWDQSGVKELVTITVPKRIERVLTDGLSQTEVKSRLSALANTLDSRGWAVKNINVNMYNQMAFNSTAMSSDRLIAMSSVPQQVPNYDVQAADDILDERNNAVAQQFDQMITASAQAHRQQLINTMNSSTVSTPAQPANYWFMQQPPAVPSAVIATPAAQDETPEEEALMHKIRAQREQQDDIMHSHLRTLQPLSTNPADQTPAVAQPVSTPSSVGSNPAILSLANNNDLNVATLAREANKSQGPNESGGGEVVISLR